MNEFPKNLFHSETEQKNEEERRIFDDFLKEQGLEDLDPAEEMRGLLSITSIDTKLDTMDISQRDTYELAVEKMVDLIKKHPQDSSRAFFSEFDQTQIQTLRKILVAEEIYDQLLTHIERLHTNTIPAEEINNTIIPFCDEAKKVFDVAGTDPSHNYFVAQASRTLLFRIAFENEIHLIEEPFDISPTQRAVFSGDRKRLYVLEKAYLNENRVSSYPEDEYDVLFDAGTEVRDLVKQFGSSAEDIEQFLLLNETAVRSIINTDFSIDLSKLNLREKFYFLNYLKHTTIQSVEIMCTFTEKHGVNGMRTFLSLERGDETLGDHIVAFGQHDGVAGTVFKYYGELLDLADNAEDLIKESGYVGDNVTQLAEQVRERLISRAQQDLEKAVQTHNPADLSQKLETYIAKAKLEVALIQEKAKAPLEPTQATDIPEATRSKMTAISEKNYEAEPPEFQELIRSGLPGKFTNPNTRFYIDYDQEGNIIFFDAFTDVIDERTGEIAYKKFEAVNLSKEFGGAGSVRIAETLNREIESGHTMQAFCDPKNPISQIYIEHGFVAIGTVSPAGKFSFEIWHSDDSSKQLQTKQLSIAELVEQVEHPNTSAGYEIRKVEPNDQFPELNKDKYLTRYFKHNGELYAVFEPTLSSLQQEITLLQKEQKEAA